MRTVLITGGAGFIGSHLAEHLLDRGQAVIVLDDLSTGSLGNIATARRHPAFTFVQGSVLDPGVLNELLAKVDTVYHLAASVGVKLVVEQLIASMQNNIRGTENVLMAASQHGTKVLLTSTSEVYGRGGGEVFSETDDLAMGPTTAGRWSYACSKALDEYMAFAYMRERGLPVSVVRLFNTVGERQSSHYGMVVPTFVRQALAGDPLTIHGDGTQSRCFCHVQDVVIALTGLMEHEASVGEVYNIGSTESIMIDALADRVIGLTESSSVKVLVPYEEAYDAGFEDITKRVPDTEKLRALLDWQPILSLDDIILRVREDILSQVGVG